MYRAAVDVRPGNISHRQQRQTAPQSQTRGNIGSFFKIMGGTGFSDNYILCKVMEDEAICKEMSRILLGVKPDRIRYIKSENAIGPAYGSLGIKLDIFVKEQDRYFDLEMQTGNYSDLTLSKHSFSETMLPSLPSVFYFFHN